MAPVWARCSAPTVHPRRVGTTTVSGVEVGLQMQHWTVSYSQTRAVRAADRAAARERAEIDASRAMENGVNINPGLRELVDDPGARKWFRGESSGSASAAESD